MRFLVFHILSTLFAWIRSWLVPSAIIGKYWNMRGFTCILKGGYLIKYALIVKNPNKKAVKIKTWIIFNIRKGLIII